MGTTEQGVWYPEPEDPVSPLEAVFATMAQSVNDNVIRRIPGALSSAPSTTLPNEAVVYDADAKAFGVKDGNKWLKYVDIDSINGGDTDWQPCTTRSGFVPLTGLEAPQARIYRGFVCLWGGWSNAGMSANGNHTIGDLPSGIPGAPGSLVLAFGSSLGDAVASGFVTVGGAIIVRPPSVLGAYYKMAGINYPVP